MGLGEKRGTLLSITASEVNWDPFSHTPLEQLGQAQTLLWFKRKELNPLINSPISCWEEFQWYCKKNMWDGIKYTGAATNEKYNFPQPHSPVKNLGWDVHLVNAMKHVSRQDSIGGQRRGKSEMVSDERSRQFTEDAVLEFYPYWAGLPFIYSLNAYLLYGWQHAQRRTY